MPNLPEPIRHPSVVRAAVSPSAIALAAAGAGIGVADHSVILAIVLAGVGWGGRMVGAVVTRVRRDRAARPKPADVDPWSVPDPWRSLVRQAADAQSRFDRSVKEWPAGPTRDRLTQLQPQLYVDVAEVAAVARHGAALAGWSPGDPRGANRPSIEQLSDELRKTQVERARAATSAPAREAALARTEEGLAAQIRARRGADDAATWVHDGLRVLVARLDEAVTSLLVLSVEAAGGSGADAFASSVTDLRGELAALREGVAELQPPTAPPTP